MPTTLYVVRHAQAQHGEQSDPGLTDTGREQAEALGARRARVPISNTGLTTIRYTVGRPPELLGLDDTTHLSTPGGRAGS